RAIRPAYSPTGRGLLWPFHPRPPGGRGPGGQGAVYGAGSVRGRRSGRESTAGVAEPINAISDSGSRRRSANQRRMVWSLLALASPSPPGKKATSKPSSLCPDSALLSPEVRSQSRAVLSLLALAKNFPSGEKIPG